MPTPTGSRRAPTATSGSPRRSAGKLGVLAPTLGLVATAEPPAFVAPNAPFGLTVTVDYPSGPLDTGFNGNVTLALVNPSQRRRPRRHADRRRP